MADTNPSSTPASSASTPAKLLTVREVAEFLGISRDSVFALLRTGELRSVLIGKRGRRVTPGQLAAYLRKLERDGRPPWPSEATGDGNHDDVGDRWWWPA